MLSMTIRGSKPFTFAKKTFRFLATLDIAVRFCAENITVFVFVELFDFDCHI